ncbi:hypothetical protein TELCIR_02361 [Teladorsagia circumcincta]|uniref:Uncharacterized protein n=1 Tax=Teladorsagia circumcincta TaxID=45464 RepID=A0A2G9UZD2_TELCI|nr:hypothetical protein TELCIR_02361 [Teladorsagia circumcincta]
MHQASQQSTSRNHSEMKQPVSEDRHTPSEIALTLASQQRILWPVEATPYLKESLNHLIKMERLYQETSSLLQQAHFSMGRLERAKDEQEAQQISQYITEQLRVIDQNCDQLVILVNKEAPARRHIVRIKVDQLKNDSQNVHYAITAMLSRLSAKWRAASEREELLHQR